LHADSDKAEEEEQEEEGEEGEEEEDETLQPHAHTIEAEEQFREVAGIWLREASVVRARAHTHTHTHGPEDDERSADEGRGVRGGGTGSEQTLLNADVC
jgi:hypothetical protein